MNRPMTSTERNRLHRARQRQGLVVVKVVVDIQKVSDALMDEGRIDDEWGMPEVEDALADVLDRYADTQTRRLRRLASRGIFRS